MKAVGKLLRLVVTMAADATGVVRRAAELPAPVMVRLGRGYHRPVEVRHAHAQVARRLIRHDNLTVA